MMTRQNHSKNRFLGGAFVALLVSLSLAVSCGEDGDDDDEETAEEIQAREVSRQQTASASIMPSIDTSCGGSACISSASTSLALSSESPLQTLRNFFWLAMGFPSSTDYASFHGGSTAVQALVGQDGMIGRIEGIRSSVVSAIVANDTSITACSQVPSSGSVTIDDDETLTFGTATLGPASDWPKTGTYDKRVTYANTTTGRTAIFEFYCDYNGMMAQIVDLPNTNQKQYIMIYYDGETSTRYIEFDMFDDKNFSSSEEIYMMLNVRMDTSTSTFQSWLTRSGLTDSTSHRGYRYAAHSNYSTQKSSFHRHDVSDGFTQSEYQALTGYDSTAVAVGVAPPSANANDQVTGCADTYNTASSSITSSAYCSGMDMSAAPTPSLSSSGTMSIKWIDESLKGAMTGIQ